MKVMEKTFSEVLKEFSEKHGLDDLHMASLLGISERMYKDYVNAKFKGSEGRVRGYMLRLREYTDSLDMSVPTNEAEPVYAPAKGGNIIFIPLVAYGGFLHGYANKVFMDTMERFSLPRIHGEHFAFEVQGTSMSPYANPGDVVISRKEEQVEWMIRGRPYVVQTIDGIIIKIFDKIEGGKAYFRSADKNSNHPSVPLKEIKGIYQVVKVLRDIMNVH